LVMVETKQTKVAKPKATSKPRKSKATLKKGKINTNQQSKKAMLLLH